MRIAKTHHKSKLQYEVAIGTHLLTADAETEAGGEDAGPAPHDYLNVALASCTAITLSMYAARKKWPLDDVQVAVTFEKVGDETVFKKSIQLIGNLDSDQKQRLLEIADKCPVHKILSGKIRIEALS